MPESVKKQITTVLNENIEKYKCKINARMEEFANNEIEKYELWANDQLVPLQNQIIEIRKEKDALHKQVRKERNVKEKLLLKKKETLLADKLTKIQRSYFDMEDEYNKDVDQMTTKLLESLECKYGKQLLFSVRWSFV